MQRKFLKEMRTTPVNTQMIRKPNSCMWKSFSNLDRGSNQSQYSLSSKSQIQSKTLILFSSVKAKRDVEATKEKFEDWFMRLMKSHLCNIEVWGEGSRADVEAAPSYPEYLPKISNKKTFQYLRTFIAREDKSMPGFKISKLRRTGWLSCRG